MIIVVGGGVTGLSTAFWLRQMGHPVTLVEKGIVGWEASGRNGGGCTHPYSPLFREEQRLWPMMDELLGYPTEWRPHRIRIGLDEAQMTRLRAATMIATDQGFQSEELDNKALREFCPWVAEGTPRAIHWKHGGHANPQRTVQAYAWAIADRGGTILQHTTVQAIETRGGRAVAVKTDKGSIGCDAVVVAAGPHTAAIARSFDVRVPLAPARVEMIVTEPLPLLELGGIDGNGLYGRQTLRGNLAYGGGPHEWIDLDGPATPRAVNSPVVAGLARRLAELFTRLPPVRVIRSWGGIVENTPDGRPVLERLSDPDNVVIATMSSVGFGLSPATGRALAQLVVEGECDFADLSQLKLSRFGNLAPDWRARQGWVAGA
ncbi:MAG: FAD-binding oxidoreductase [Acetobacteraceae bacterium]|nr:FAD-binding oxidoreductase [Acetobacteraceae bacterium]